MGGIMNKWISVKESLPQEYGYYLVYIHEDKKIELLDYYKHNEWEGDLGWATTENYGITHWMPLPECPTINEEQ